MNNQMPLKPVWYPIKGTFELTIRCNLHCSMCLFRHDDCENASIKKCELSTQEWIDIARQTAEAGTLNLLITGGEPMLRSDFCEIWEGIYNLGFILQLYTNATLVTPKIMECLTKYPPHSIGITVYGSNPTIYKKVTGSSEAFNRMINGVKQLQTLPSVISFRTTIIKDNYEDVDAIEKLIADEFNYHGIVNEPRSLFPPVRGGSSDAKSVRLDPRDNVNLIFRRSINSLKEIVGNDEKFNQGHLTISAEKKCDCVVEKVTKKVYTLFGCDAGMKSYSITYDGKLLGCQTLGVFSTDVKREGFQKAWERFPSVVRIPGINKKCSECSISEHCETCFAAIYAETGSLDGCPDYQCQDAHEIAKLINGGVLL